MFSPSFEQRIIINSDKSQIVVVAAAGRGKSATLIWRLGKLLEEGADPSSIYVITYTNNAAQELQLRVGRTDFFVGTIHSLANRILMSNGIDTSKVRAEEDFDKLFALIKTHSPAAPTITHLLIDEFQDIDKKQFDFIFNFLKPENYMVVGDSRQAIYGFKGASYEWFEKLIYNPETTVYTLTEDYRNPAKIIRYADHFLKDMDDIYRTPIKSMVEWTGSIEDIEYSDNDLIGRIKKGRGQYSDWFVLCRTNREVNRVLDLLKNREIPCETFKKGDLSFEELQSSLLKDTVKVLTIHASKGLENKNVAVIGAQYYNSEEKRLCYVAATRASHNLIWYTKPRKFNKRKSNIIDFR